MMSWTRNTEKNWIPPELPAEIPHGDMPGDSIHIGETHRQKANVIFPELLSILSEMQATNPHERAVISVCGGSGVGKSETASLLAYYFRSLGVGSYTLSGDNYPRRIPLYNDAERMRIYRLGGMKGLVANGVYTPERGETARALQAEERDADPSLTTEYPWLKVYQREGRTSLAGYLGSPAEQDFEELNAIVSQFKNGTQTIALKRMGREETALWYEPVDFSGIRVLLIEWTHGNSDHLHGVDIPILLNSTPSETLAYRKERHRDGGTDSPFTTMVLQLEQKQLEMQAGKARLIVAKTGELLPYREYRRLMAEE
jgi:hypothetical protein